MYRTTRNAFLLVTLALPLVGCGALGGNYDFDPTEIIPGDFFGLAAKKKLPGERKPVFPEGVPGTTRGIPPELVRGYQGAPDGAQDALATTQQAGLPREEPKPKPKVQAKAKTPPKATTATTQSTPGAVDARWPDSDPPPQQPPQRQAQPAPPRQPAQPASSAPPWPDAPVARGPATGGFQTQWPDPPPAGNGR